MVTALQVSGIVGVPRRPGTEICLWLANFTCRFAPPTIWCGTLPGSIPSVIIEEIMRCSLSPLHCMPGMSELGSREESWPKWPAMRLLARYTKHCLRPQRSFIRNTLSLFPALYPWKGRSRYAGLKAGWGSHLEPRGCPVPAVPSQRFLQVSA